MPSMLTITLFLLRKQYNQLLAGESFKGPVLVFKGGNMDMEDFPYYIHVYTYSCVCMKDFTIKSWKTKQIVKESIPRRLAKYPSAQSASGASHP